MSLTRWLIHNNKQGIICEVLGHKEYRLMNLGHLTYTMTIVMLGKLFTRRRDCKPQPGTFRYKIDKEVHRMSMAEDKRLQWIRVHLTPKTLGLWMVCWRPLVMTCSLSQWELERNKVNGLLTLMLLRMS